MVKTPRTRHSRTEKEPVTIDLAPDEVSRVKSASGNGTPGQKTPPPAEARPDAPAAGKAAAGEAEAKETAAKKTEEKTPFGRQDGEAPAAAATAASGTAGPARPAEPSAPPRRESGGGLIAGLVGGVAALALAAGLQFAGVLPGVAPAPPSSPAAVDHGPAIAALETQLGQLREEVAALGAAGDGGEALAARLAEAEERVAALASGLEALRGEVSGLAARPEGEGGAAAPVDLAPIEERIAAVEAALAAVPDASASESALAALGEQLAALRGEVEAGRDGQAQAAARLDALEAAVEALSGRVEEQAEAPATAVIIAASSLKAAIDRGMPFTTELETYAALVPDAPQIEELRAFAASGVPTRAEISAQSDAAANAMIAAAQPVDPQAGIIDRLWASMSGMVQVRPIGMVEGDGVPEIAARLDTAVTAGDYERALAEFETLPAAAKAAGEAFIAKVRARHAADRLADEALAAALKA